jgi:hypothetical protein
MAISKWKYKCKNGHIFERPYTEEQLFYSKHICPICNVKEFRKILVADIDEEKNIVSKIER